MKHFFSQAIVPLLALSVFLLSAALIHAEERLVYVEETDGERADFVIDVADIDGAFALTKSFDGDVYRETCDQDWNTLSATVIVEQRIGTVRRRGDELRVSWPGGETASYEIDGARWRQNLFRMTAFITDPEAKKTDIWMITPHFNQSPDEQPRLKTMRFTLKKKDAEILEIGGRETEVIRVELRPDGFMGAFWSADYWFRTSDGVLVKYAMARGAPGTPVTVGTLEN